MTDIPDPYPEHTKLKAINHLSQAVSDFLDWLEGQCIRLARYEQPSDNWMTEVTMGRQRMLSIYFGIDLEKLEAEKQKMLDAQRALNERTG